MAHTSKLSIWRGRETKLAKARYEGFSSLSRFSKKRRKHIDIPLEELQARNNRFFDNITRGGSYGCTARRLA